MVLNSAADTNSFPEPEKHPFHRTAFYAGGVAIIVIAALLRYPQLDESLWLDELHTAWCVSDSWGDVAPRAAIGNQSPLYFWLLRGVVETFGYSESSLRFPSLIAGLTLVGVAGIVAGSLARSTAIALLAAALVALDRNAIFYSQEARPYALLQTVAWLHVFVVWRLIHRPTPLYRVLFIGGAVLQFYLHYTAALFLIAEGVFLVDTVRRTRVAVSDQTSSGYRLPQLALDVGLVALAILPSLPHLQAIAARREQWERFIAVPNWGSLLEVLHVGVYLFPTAAVWLGWIALRPSAPSSAGTETRKVTEPAVALLSCLILVPAVLAWIATRRHWAALFFTRYLVSGLIAVPIAGAVFNRILRSPLSRTLAAAATIGVSLWNSGIVQQWERDGRVIADRRQDWRGAVAFVNQQAHPDDQAWVRGGFVEADGLGAAAENPLLVDYCLAPVTSLYPLVIRAIPLPNRPEEALDDLGARGWVIVNGSRSTRLRFLEGLAKRYSLVGERTFGEVLVAEIEPR